MKKLTKEQKKELEKFAINPDLDRMLVFERDSWDDLFEQDEDPAPIYTRGRSPKSIPTAKLSD